MFELKCYLCGKQGTEIGKTRDTHEPVFRCICGLRFLGSGYKNMYENINPETVTKAYYHDDFRRISSLGHLISNKNVLDFGCGSGSFMNMASPFCNISGVEKEIINQKVYSDISEITEKFDIITMFSSLEHLPDPRATLKQLSELLVDGGKIIIEIPNMDDILMFLGCKEYINFKYWSCHPFMYNADTLKELVKQSGLIMDSLKFIQRWPLSNTLHWLARGKRDGHKEWWYFDNPELHAQYEKSLGDKCDTIMAQVSVKQ